MERKSNIALVTRHSRVKGNKKASALTIEGIVSEFIGPNHSLISVTIERERERKSEREKAKRRESERW